MSKKDKRSTLDLNFGSLEDALTAKAVKEIEKLNLEIEGLQEERIDADSTYHAARVYGFSSQVSTQSIYHAMHTLSEWIRRDETAPIEIVFNSPGGYVLDGFAFYDFIQYLRSTCVVTTRCLGFAASMAGVLLQAGTERIISPNSYFMIHETSTETWGKTSEMKDEMELMEAMQERAYGILADRSSLSVKKIKERSARKDWWLTAKEAKKYGFVDRVEF